MRSQESGVRSEGGDGGAAGGGGADATSCVPPDGSCGEGLAAGLYVVGTPIGNLEDITLRALKVLGRVSAVYAEDTRHTRVLLERYGIDKPLVSCHQFNERARLDELLERVRRGEAVALVSDAGMPGISDPGGLAAATVRRAGLPVRAVPGPTAVATAVAMSGAKGGGGYWFEGFLDNRTAARRRRLKELSALGAPVVFYESTHRILKLLDEVEEELGAERRLLVGRELTKAHEEWLEGTPGELRAHYASGHSHKGEFTVVLYPEGKGKNPQGI